MNYDINLMPKNSKAISGFTLMVIVISSVCFVVIGGLFGYYLPTKEKNNLKNLIDHQEREILRVESSEIIYNKVNNQLNELRRTNSILDMIKSSNIVTTQIFNDIDDNIPTKIYMQKYTMKEDIITLEGFSPTYKEIAQFIVKLRELPYISSVTFDKADINLDDEQKPKDFRFIIYAYMHIGIQDELNIGGGQ